MKDRERQLIYDALCETLFYAEDNGGYYQSNYSVEEIRNLADKYKPQYENNVELDNAAENYTDSSEWLPGENLEHLDAAFKEGAKWQKEKMMKGAVEGIVKYHDYPEYNYVLVPYEEFNDGDKVRVIIVKEEEDK